jgi:Rab GDP dissociation inhibitor
VYVFCCSYSHCVVGKNKWVAFVSTRVETGDPVAELAPGLALLGPIEHTFTQLSDVYEPYSDGALDACYISRGYDETSHFEGLTADVLDLYRRITGRELDLSADPAAAAGGPGGDR